MRMVGELVADNPGERVGERGHTLGQYLDDFAGIAGPIEDPYGLQRTLSLAAFDGGNPDSYLAITFVEQTGDEPLPPIEPGQVLLDEYDLPDVRPAWLPPLREA